MKIVYLILAHKDPLHFGRLVKALLGSENSIVFAHIDKKSDIRVFERATSGLGVHYLRRRINVNWGGVSVVRATLNLMSEAYQYHPGANYYCLLSGSDFLLRSIDFVEAYLGENRGSEFINIEALEESTYKSIDLISLYHPNVDLMARCFPRFIRRRFEKVIRGLKIKRSFQEGLRGMKPYVGSQWWVLSTDSLNYILNFVSNNQWYLKFFKNAVIPDELFFQTILGNSSFHDRIKRNLMYVDWSRGTLPSPAFLDIESIYEIKQLRMNLDSDGRTQSPEFLFGRKFNNESAILTEEIKKILW